MSSSYGSPDERSAPRAELETGVEQVVRVHRAPMRGETEMREQQLAIRRHQIRQQCEHERPADRHMELYMASHDPDVKAACLALSNEHAIAANRIRTAVSLTNWMVPEGADEEARRLERERES